MEINQRQQEQFSEIVTFILNFTKDNGYPPSVRQIGESIGKSSSSTIHKILKQCEEHGFIEINPKIARGIVVSPAGKRIKTKPKK